ncbi:MAG: YdcF family protein [Actinomycetota bacterium]|nr:YdcF family protein [Actinomycetota bacterium]
MRLSFFGGLTRQLRALFDVYRGGRGTIEERSESSRVAVVLGTQVLPGGRASRTLEARVRHAARLYKEGGIRLLVPTGGLGEHPPSEAVVMARILREEGVPESDVLLEDRARNTWDSARLVAGMAEGLGVRSVVVVTDPVHCVRTVAAFRRAGLMASAEPVYSSPMWRGKWRRRGQLVREIGALAWYRMRYGVG